MTTLTVTASGRRFDLLHPEPGQVDIRDIAFHLATSSRFAGACPAAPYFIAQHSVHVADSLAEPAWRIYGLMHDAHEYVAGDVTSPAENAIETLGPADHAIIADEVNGLPVSDAAAGDMRLAAERIAQRLLSGRIKRLKRRIDESAIWPAFGLAPPPPRVADAVHLADQQALATETRDLLAPGTAPLTLAKPWSHTIKAWPWPDAEAAFLNRFEQYLATARQAGMAA